MIYQVLIGLSYYFYYVSHTVLVCSSVQHVPSMKHFIQIFYFLKKEKINTFCMSFCYVQIFFSRFFFFSMVHENNLISEAYLFFTINLHHSRKFQTPRMIKAVLDSKHMTIPSKVVPFIYINPISLVGNNLFQGTSVKESSKLIRTAKLI